MNGKKHFVIPLDCRDIGKISAPEQDLEGGWSRKQLDAHLESPSGWQFAVRTAEKGEIVAYALGRCVADEAEILRFAVVPSYQRQGMASMLLGYIREHLFRCGIRTCHLEVRDSNRAAQKLYEKMGFSVGGRRPAYYSDPVEDAVLMTVQWTKEK